MSRTKIANSLKKTVAKCRLPGSWVNRDYRLTVSDESTI